VAFLFVCFFFFLFYPIFVLAAAVRNWIDIYIYIYIYKTQEFVSSLSNGRVGVATKGLFFVFGFLDCARNQL
jgi:hypothetical protein